MCLSVGGKQPRVAKRDIVCYKTVRASFLWGFRLISAYREFEYRLGETYSKRPGEKTFRSLRYVNGEGYHSFIKRPTKTYAVCREQRWSSSVVLKCVIPKGTLYYSADGERASRAIRIVSVLDWVTGEEVELRKNPRAKRGFSFHRKRAPYRAKNRK